MNSKPIDLEYARYLYQDCGYTISKVAKTLHRDCNVVGRQMRKNGIITKENNKTYYRCGSCGKKYVNYEMVFGLPKCPHCWYTHFKSTPVSRSHSKKSIDYTNQSIKQRVETRSKGLDLGLFEHSFFPDNGCETAKIVFGNDTTCLTCKFERCLQELDVRASSKKVTIGVTDDDGNIVGKTEVEVCRIY